MTLRYKSTLDAFELSGVSKRKRVLKNEVYPGFGLIKVKYNNGKQQRVESQTEENHEKPQDKRLPSRDLNMGLPVYEGSATNSTELFGLFQTTLRDSCW